MTHWLNFSGRLDRVRRLTVFVGFRPLAPRSLHPTLLSPVPARPLRQNHALPCQKKIGPRMGTGTRAVLQHWHEEQESNQNEVTLPKYEVSPLISNNSLVNHSGDDRIKKSTGIPRDWLVQLLQKYNSSTDSHDADDILRNKALVVAPMVDQSDLPFRVLCRKYGANLCYTPMIHARMFVNNEQGYRNKFWKKVEEHSDHQDRPLIVQFAGGDPSILAKAAKIVQGRCDAIDLNCGCPQSIAKRGNYGAYLLEQEELVLRCIRALRQAVPGTPITVKVRLLPIISDDSGSCSIHSSISDSISLYLKFIEAGVSLITVHGRNRFQKGSLMGSADWYAIQQVVQVCGQYVPIIANGSCASLHDVEECLRITGADGVMLSEAVLEYPPIFLRSSSGTEAMEKQNCYDIRDETQQGIRTRAGPGRLQIAREYLDLCLQYPPHLGGQGSGMKCIKMHLHRFLHADLQVNTTLRDLACRARTHQDMVQLLDAVQNFHTQINHQVEKETLSWYMRYRNNDHPPTSVSLSKMAIELDSDEDTEGSNDDYNDKGASLAMCLFGKDEEEDY